MWVIYYNHESGKTKKFNLPKDKPAPEKIEHPPKSGIWWYEDDPKLLGKKSGMEELEVPVKLGGIAILTKDPITGLNYWATFNAEGEEHTNLSPAQPVIVPATVQIGTRVEISFPE
jgi:hypothetical protein